MSKFVTVAKVGSIPVGQGATFPLGDQLVLYTGIDDFESRKKAKAKVVLQVFIDDKRVATIGHQNAWPWHRSVIDTAGHSGKRGKVRFEISTPARLIARKRT